MKIADIRKICYREQKVIIRLVYRNAIPDKILYFGRLGDIRDDNVLNRDIGSMYTRDDCSLAISVFDGRE